MFDARYETVWSAAKGAAQYHDLDILDADKATGFISARRRMNETTFGENVCIWIREVAPAQTEVEVVGRRSGPPVLDRGDWELRIQRTISTILSI
ncbi:MAG: hypothetical protein JWR26_2044 [Pedosphaera sp.]|nr:hypothetical protein [Pedosphaera sp.]